MSTRRRLLTVTAALAAMIVVASPALAHVTVNPSEAAKGGFTKLTFRVPNERDDAGTVKLEVQFPEDHPIPFVSTKPKAGWTITTETRTLATPIESGGGEVTEAVSVITWEADADIRIGPGEFDEFDVSVGPLPDDAEELVFPAIQTYDSGEEVAWIEPVVEGEAEPEHPAPVLALTGSAGDEDHAATVDASEDDGDGDGNGLAIAALAVGIVALVAAGASLFRGRSRTA